MTPEDGRRPLIAGNWKLWGTKAQAAEYCERLKGLLPPDGEERAEIGVCPVFTALETFEQALDGASVAVFAQNMHKEETGAFTGEVAPGMLTELGVNGVVLGHSERREYNCESDRALQEKVPAALASGLRPILCVGESEEERERDETQRKDRSKGAAERVRILYGGSVKPDNAREILAQPDVDGALVGGASLDPKGLLEIAAAAP